MREKLYLCTRICKLRIAKTLYKPIFCLTQTNYHEKTFYSCHSPYGKFQLVVTGAVAKAVKRLKNGMLIIEKNGKIYNILGARVK